MQHDRDTVEHGWCNQLRNSQAFTFFLNELRRPLDIAHREVTAEKQQSREFHAGRLSAFVEASSLIERKYAQLAKTVEVVE